MVQSTRPRLANRMAFSMLKCSVSAKCGRVRRPFWCRLCRRVGTCSGFGPCRAGYLVTWVILSVIWRIKEVNQPPSKTLLSKFFGLYEIG